VTRALAAPAVRVHGLAKAFGRGPAVLRVDALELAGPALVRVEGANGAGKSTLLRLLAGVTRPTRGRIAWCGEGRAFVPERFRATGALRVGELLALAGAGALLGVAELADRRMAALSQGQAQRVALAAALGRPAAVVVLDEPFTALDAEAAGELERLLLERARESLVILADHEERLAPAARVVVAGGEASTASNDWRASLRAAGIEVRER
jgi:ABC-2 type transport system ATP-binding protein